MKINSLITTVLTTFIILTGCEKNEPNDGLVSAILFYTPSCATINGRITLDGDNDTYVFQHEIEEKFRQDEIKVLLSFEKASGNGLLTAECTQAPIIIIIDMKEN